MQFSPTKYNLVRQNLMTFLVRQNEFFVRQKHRAIGIDHSEGYMHRKNYVSNSSSNTVV
jgi:hypothetical protein